MTARLQCRCLIGASWSYECGAVNSTGLDRLELEWTLGGVGREAQVDIYLRRLLKSKTPSDQSFVIVVPVEYFSDLSMWPHIIFPPRVIIIKIILINDWIICRVLNKSRSTWLAARSIWVTIWELLPSSHKMLFLKYRGSEMLYYEFFWRYMQSNMLVGWLGKHV